MTLPSPGIAWTRHQEEDGSTLITTASVGSRSGLRSNTVVNDASTALVPAPIPRIGPAWRRTGLAVALSLGLAFVPGTPTPLQVGIVASSAAVEEAVADPSVAPVAERSAQPRVDAALALAAEAHQLRLVAAAEADRGATLWAAAEQAVLAQPAPAAPAVETVPVPAPVVEVAAAPAPPMEVASLPRHERIGQEALARLRHLDAAAVGWTVSFHPGRDGYLGMADFRTKTVDVWIRDRHDVQDVLGTLAHELAHAYDYERWGHGLRSGWLAQRGLDLQWWPECTCDDRGYGAGDIAEAMVVLEAGEGEWTGRFGMPTRAQLDWLARQL